MKLRKTTIHTKPKPAKTLGILLNNLVRSLNKLEAARIEPTYMSPKIRQT